MAANSNSVFYKIGQAVKSQISNNTPDVSGKADLTGATFTGDVSGTNLNLTNDLTVSGKLKVLGEQTVTKITEENLDIKDNFIGLNRGASVAANNTKDIGMYFERGSSEPAGAIVFDETNDKFVVGYMQAVAGGYQVTIVTDDGDVKVDVSGALWDAMYAKAVEGGQTSINFTVSNSLEGNVNGFAEDPTQIEFQINHPDVVNADSGVFFDGAASEQDLIDAINALDFSGTSQENTGSIVGVVVVGSGAWDAEHVFQARYGNITSMEISEMPTSSDLSGIGGYTSLNLQSASGVATASSGDASSSTASTEAATLKVGSLEIGNDIVGDFADFEAGLVA